MRPRTPPDKPEFAQPLRPPEPLAADRDRAPPSREALDQLFLIVHDELRRVAHGRLALERPGHTLSTTALVHETYLRLARQDQVRWADRGQFFALAALAMRRILIDYARRHRKLRDQVTYETGDSDDDDANRVRLAAAERSEALLALDEALTRLAGTDARCHKVVECRFFAGLTEEETAQALGVTARTVARDWVKARAWLFRELEGAGPALPQ